MMVKRWIVECTYVGTKVPALDHASILLEASSNVVL